MTSSELSAALNAIAEPYVKLVLAVGQHDADYVDAYYGPPEWQEEAKAEKHSLDTILQTAIPLKTKLDELQSKRAEDILQLRHHYLRKQFSSLIARVEVLGGKKFSFDEEAKAYYDVEPPVFAEEYFKKLVAELESIVPGNGPIPDRVENYRRQFTITPDKLDKVFNAAIFECRQRTKKYIILPENETFRLEYVHNKAWSGYNWYKGNNESLIQINTDLPIFMERAIDLAAHEGYPGHHVYNCLLETAFARKLGWVEFTVYPLFSSQSLIAEGTANFGIEVAFPGKERMEFERDKLFPLAGLDKSQAEKYSKVQELAAKLSYAGNEAARRYLNGEISRDDAAQWLVHYALMSPERAQQRTRFFDQYRSYVINYNLGLDLVRQYIERRGGTEKNPAKRWEEFTRLLASPRLPSGLI
ncbi:MAG: hypothetical protein NTX44_05490 [Ignavibacteriales bacterium]|nr:hypothetical protein [Ignavibacteriales bacterium]